MPSVSRDLARLALVLALVDGLPDHGFSPLLSHKRILEVSI